MDDKVSRVLKSIVNLYGLNRNTRSALYEGYLKDCFPENKKEIFILMTALREGMVYELLSSRSSKEIADITARKIVYRLQQECGFTHGISCWAVQSWAIALGMEVKLMVTSSGAPTVKVSKINVDSKGNKP